MTVLFCPDTMSVLIADHNLRRRISGLTKGRDVNSTVEHVWETHGLTCAVLRMDMGHRCGYVGVPNEHPWHGIAYNAPAPTEPVDISNFTQDDVGIIPAFCFGISDDDKRAEYSREPGFQVAVHGGLTFSSGTLEGVGDGWWFGFDTAHGGDSPDHWTLERMVTETERMAEQLAAVAERPVVSS